MNNHNGIVAAMLGMTAIVKRLVAAARMPPLAMDINNSPSKPVRQVSVRHQRALPGPTCAVHSHKVLRSRNRCSVPSGLSADANSVNRPTAPHGLVLAYTLLVVRCGRSFEQDSAA